jgi:murein DD-endopeptidase MepM/ murein hydrolase activator NlpD
MINENIPENIIMEFIKLFSFDIDFQRDIRTENILTVYYDYYKDEKQNYIKSDVIHFAKIKLHNQSFELYRFTNEKRELIDYFDSNGKSATKALMKTPINGARLSSAYGMRKHPILGYNKLHQGVDFAAPTGTPIMAAGTGRIEFIGTNGGYGKHIRLKHLNGYKTSYSHLNSYASGMSKGVKVRQGQTIGFVGSTGMSTGPHLHYEVWFNNKKINPMTMRLPSGIQLNENQLEKFKRVKGKIDLEINNEINL